MSDEVFQSQCPNCGKWIDDFDGFGVPCHAECGYCSHPCIDGDVCACCGRQVRLEVISEKPLICRHVVVEGE